MENLSPPQIIRLKESGDQGLPVLIYRNIIDEHAARKDKIFQQRFADNRWSGTWKNGIYDYYHFHSNAHEALGIARGFVTIELGGSEKIDLEAGDMIVLPAGTGHQRIYGSDNLVVIGAYPAGQENYDMCCARDENKTAAAPLPQTDPFYGPGGFLTDIWSSANG